MAIVLTDKRGMHRSIFTRLTLFFAFIVFAVGVGFYFIDAEIGREYRAGLEKESDAMMTHIRRTIVMPEEERIAYFEENGYSYGPVTPESRAGLKKAFETIPERFSAQIRASIEEGRIEVLRSGTTLYVLINRSEAPFMIGSYRPNRYIMWLWSGFLALLFLIVSFYLSIIYSLLPLQQLARAIRKYGENGTYVPTKSSGRDEIAYVANAFDEAVRKNRALTEARRLFMRNVMHELKTPITVGKLALPFLPQSSETEILERAFKRMEILLGDMAHVEQVSSQSIICEPHTCSLSNLTDEAAALMLSKEGSIVREFGEDDLIYADCRMMVSVFKNLIDNAFKYSEDKRVVIRRDGDALLFINRGKPWPAQQHFEMMLEPFAYNNPSGSSKSFGLGLYIVKSILDTHRIGFSHDYRDGEHSFILENIPQPPR